MEKEEREREEDGGYIASSIHSAENHRGTFRGVPMRVETGEKERNGGEKKRELVASTKLKQKAWGNTSCRSKRTSTHAVVTLVFSSSRLDSRLSSLSPSLPLISNRTTVLLSIRPAPATCFFLPTPPPHLPPPVVGRSLFFFLFVVYYASAYTFDVGNYAATYSEDTLPGKGDSFAACTAFSMSWTEWTNRARSLKRATL